MTRRAIGNISKVDTNRYKVTVTVGWSVNGTQKRVSRTVRGSRRDAEREIQRILAESGQARAEYTLRDYVSDIWLPDKAVTCRERTMRQYRLDAKKLTGGILSDMDLSDIQVGDVERWLEAYDGAAAFNAYKTLRQVLRYAHRHRIVRDVVTDYVEPPRYERKEISTVTTSTLPAYLAAVSGDPIEPGILVALSTGSRRSEVVALDWGDIVWDGGDGWLGRFDIAKAAHEREEGGILIDKPKSTSSTRTEYIPAWAGSRLKELASTGPLVSWKGERMHPSYFSARWKRCCERASIPYITVKNLRHSVGTMMVQELAMPVGDVQAVLGHSSPSTTTRFYVQKSDAPVVRAASAFGTLAPFSTGTEMKENRPEVLT